MKETCIIVTKFLYNNQNIDIQNNRILSQEINYIVHNLVPDKENIANTWLSEDILSRGSEEVLLKIQKKKKLGDKRGWVIQTSDPILILI